MKRRIVYLDILRCLACLMVILMHTPKPYSASGWVLSGISLLTAPCIGLFFMVSGALLLPVSISTNEFLKHRLTKIAIPALIWTLIEVVINAIANQSFYEGLRSVLSIPFSVQGNPTLWFVHAIIGLYLVAPIISPWLLKASKREIELFLLLWGVTLCFPFIRSFVAVDQSTSGVLYYFAGYLGYFVFGYYLHNHVERLNGVLLVGLFVVPLCCAAICKLSNFRVDFYDWFWYQSILVTMMCMAIFMQTKLWFGKTTINPLFRKYLTDFTNCTFGIYLFHFFVVRRVLWKFNLNLLSDGGIVETFVLATIISYLLVHLISRLPKSEYLVGHHR